MAFKRLALAALAALSITPAACAAVVSFTFSDGSTVAELPSPSNWGAAPRSQVSLHAGNCAPVCGEVRFFNTQAEDRLWWSGLVFPSFLTVNGITTAFDVEIRPSWNVWNPDENVPDELFVKQYPGGGASGLTVSDPNPLFVDEDTVGFVRIEDAAYVPPGTGETVPPVPLPGALPLAMIGFASLAGLKRLRRKA